MYHAKSSLKITKKQRKELAMCYVGDESLKKSILLIIASLVDFTIMSNVDVRIMKYVLFLGKTETRKTPTGTFHRIFVNPKAKRLMKTKRGLLLMYAVLAHEIGHIRHYEKAMQAMKEEDFTLKFKLQAEVEADKYAHAMLAGIFTNPAEILLAQAAYAFEKSLRNKNATSADIEKAQLFHAARKNALLHINKT